MKKTKVTGKEFKSLLKEIGLADVKEDGYGYILLVISSDLLSDSMTLKELGCIMSSRKLEKQAKAIYDLLKYHGYYNEERINRNETRN